MSADGRSPYSPPGTGVGDQRARLSRRIGWKIYFWAMLLLSVLVYSTLGIGWMQLLDWLDLAVAVVALVGLFGFAYRRRIGSGAFWRRWLPFEILWDVAIVLFVIPAGLAYQIPGEEPSSALADMVSFALLVPFYVAFYRYGYRSPEIWSAGP